LRAPLEHAGSLTAWLQARYPGFRVRLLCQGWGPAHRDEYPTLGLVSPARVWVREVLLMQGDLPLVYAHSVIARPALRRGFTALRRQGSRPLGATLFADPRIARGPILVAEVDRRHPLWRKAAHVLPDLPPRLWARRSVFRRGQAKLLVTELFLPPLVADQTCAHARENT
jgi:chorismate--pyruvate lyase